MTAYQQGQYTAMRKQAILDFQYGLLGTVDAARMLQMSTVGFWKLRKSFARYGDIALTGRKRGPKPWNRPHNHTATITENLVATLYRKYPYLGARRLAEMLMDDHQIMLHRNTVLRILHRTGLRARPPDPPRDPILYTKDAPGQEIQLDTSFPEGKGGRVDFVGVDDHTRWTIAHVGTRATEAQSIRFLHRLVRTAPFHVTAVRTDNGPEFKRKFARACLALGIRHIKNPTYSPERNGKVERMHRTLLEECYWRYALLGKSLSLMNYRLSQYLAHYNYRRRHSGMGMDHQSPFTKLTSYLTHLPTLQPADINLTVEQYMP